MPERELERVMREFIAQKHNVLLCSTIIETGIDVPTANTIVIARADKFGLAQLHQLRGRVGRSHHQAYAYLMVPDVEASPSRRRSGWRRSSRWRNWARASTSRCTTWRSAAPARCWARTRAATCWRSASSCTTRCWPRRCARSRRQGAGPAGAAVGHHRDQPARARLLPDDYCGDVHLRLSFYKKLATAKTSDQIDRLLEEIVDRFGKLPPQAQTLIDVHRLRVLARPYGVVKVDAAPTRHPHHLQGRTRRSSRCASSSWCRRTSTSSWPATTSCASRSRWWT
jgi:transcription-repair coupling factor (superfamily II helicase)